MVKHQRQQTPARKEEKQRPIGQMLAEYREQNHRDTGPSPIRQRRVGHDIGRHDLRDVQPDHRPERKPEARHEDVEGGDDDVLLGFGVVFEGEEGDADHHEDHGADGCADLEQGLAAEFGEDEGGAHAGDELRRD